MKISHIVALGTILWMTAQAETNDVVPLWPDTAPGAEKWLNATNLEESLVRPTLTIFLPASDKASGTGLLIIPGGGYSGCCYTYEGFDLARWCNEHGIAAFVLRYRRPVAQQQRLYDHTVPALDARRALRLIRTHATEWQVNPGKLGVMGFSAGGHLAATLGVHFDAGQPAATDPVERESSRPDFMTLVYPVISMQNDAIAHGGSRKNLLGETLAPHLLDYYSSERQVTSNTPPTFLVCSTADKVVAAENSVRMYLALKAHDVPAELHVFEQGAHGFALRAPKLPVTTYWPTLFLAWLSEHGWAAKPE
ncbi:MAG: alpha/beta hydrolase [Verrucomicrobia bacterium]|nr:MAG: alpha/beta hydrolase [Verrucomicrobiota bacterium]